MRHIVKKKKDKITLEEIGGNCEGVTGSCTSIKFNKRHILFECGGIQDGRTVLENYSLNKAMTSKIKPQDIEYIFIGHCHYDHIGNIVTLFATGKCNAKIIAPEGSTQILKEMWLDSAYINQRDTEQLSLRTGKEYLPLYTESDVLNTLSHVFEYAPNVIHQLDDQISFRFIPSGHILCSQQMELFLKDSSSHIKKIVFTSDLGNTLTQDSRIFVENFQPIEKANIVIGECTYAARGTSMSKKDLQKDIEKIRSVITQYCLDSRNRVLIPSFSLDRMAYILWILYKLFGSDQSFKVPILVDSPLAIRLLQCYSSILSGEAKEKYDEMMKWKNIKLIITPEDSKAAIIDNRPKVICSSSGMLTAGRSIKWTQSILPHSNDCILFIGYAGADTLAYKIKHNRKQKTININGKPCKNNCQIVDLKSFSSHMQRNELLNYYKNFNCDKICLVHSDKNSRLEFKEDLEAVLSKCCKTTRVIAVNRSTKISL
nr:MAG TPA: hypothetical protein [Caudoviricetes sp.]